MSKFEFPEFADHFTSEELLNIFHTNLNELRQQPIGYKKVTSFYNKPLAQLRINILQFMNVLGELKITNT